MATRVIVIGQGDPDTGILTLSDKGHTKARSRDTIIWRVDPDPNSKVDAITAIEKKSGSDEIFPTDPQQKDQAGRMWQGEIATVPECSVYIYSISWRDKSGGGPHKHDPVISIKPSPITPVSFLVGLIIGLLSILGIFYLINGNKKRR